MVSSFWDRYKLIRPLGEGGMGVVYLARQVGPRDFERLVVVKAIRPGALGEAHEALFREARLTARLSHPNIIQIIDIDEVEDVPYVVMEYVHGKTLSGLIRKELAREGVTPLRHAVTIGIDLCRALLHAHTFADENGRPFNIVHRDVKASNVLVSFGGEVKLIDFGLAKAPAVPSDTITGEMKGTVGYMSPEQARGDRRIDHRSDIFSLGVLLYRLLTGVSPFKRDSLFDTIQAIAGDQPPPPSTLRPELPPSLDRAIVRCLAKRVEERFASVRELQTILQEGAPSWTGDPHELLAAYVESLFPGERAQSPAAEQEARPSSGEELLRLSHHTVMDREAAGGNTLHTAPTSRPGMTLRTRLEANPGLAVVEDLDTFRPRRRASGLLAAFLTGVALVGVAAGWYLLRPAGHRGNGASVEPRRDQSTTRAHADATAPRPPDLGQAPVRDARIAVMGSRLRIKDRKKHRHATPVKGPSVLDSDTELVPAHSKGTLVIRSRSPGSIRFLGQSYSASASLPLRADRASLSVRLTGSSLTRLELSYERKGRVLVVTLDSTPWAIVYLEGQRPGRTPYVVSVTAVRRRVELRRPDAPDVSIDLQYLVDSAQD